jgi:predicted  nucleic acid-binding Zn-ribbon protein
VTVVCQKCGKVFPGTTVIWPCPNCGWTGSQTIIDTATNYSGSVVVSGCNSSAFEAIRYAQSMLGSISYSDPKRAGFVEPIIGKLAEAAEVVKRQETELALARKSDWIKYENKLEAYRELLERNAEEPEFQGFFEENPIFLEPKIEQAYSKFSLGGELVPDFLLVLHDSSYLFVEIEKPSDRLFEKKGNPTAVFTHAQQQVRDHLKWVSNNQEFLRKRECHNLTGDNFKGLLVIGRSTDLDPRELDKLDNINAEVRSKYEVKTFDKILKENEAMLSNIKKYTK